MTKEIFDPEARIIYFVAGSNLPRSHATLMDVYDIIENECKGIGDSYIYIHYTNMEPDYLRVWFDKEHGIIKRRVAKIYPKFLPANLKTILLLSGVSIDERTRGDLQKYING